MERGDAVVVRAGLGLGVPGLGKQVAQHVVGGLGGHVEAHQAARVVVFAAGHVALGREGRVAVHQVPVDDRLHRLVGEPDRVQVLQDLRLDFLVFLLPGVGGNGDLGDLQGLAQLGIGVHHAVERHGVVEVAGILKLVLGAEEHVVLHADRVDGRAVLQLQAALLKVLVAVALERVVPVAPDVVGGLVDDQLVHREVPLGTVKGPLHKVVLLEERGRGAVAHGFVGDLPAGDVLREPLGALAEALVQQALDLAHRHRAAHPVRIPLVIVQAVRLGGDAVGLAEVHAQLRRRTAVDLVAVARVAGLALFRLQIAPVEGYGGQVEAVLEQLLVGLVLLRVLHLVQHEDICAVEEVVGLLLQGNMRSPDRLALGIQHANRAVTHAVLLDAGLHAHIHVLAVFLKGLEDVLTVFILQHVHILLAMCVSQFTASR